MTDAQVQEALQHAIVLERDARAHWQHPDTPVRERDAALEVVRHVTVVIRHLEKFVAARHAVTART